MIKKLATLLSYKKAPKTTYLLKNPVKGPKNLLALHGAKSLLMSRTAAKVGAVVATAAAAAVAIPLAWKARRSGDA